MIDANSLKQIKVAVLCGGWSSERDISLASGTAVVAGLCKAGVNAFKIDLQNLSQATETLKNTQIDCAFIALHGTGGEDGVIQGILEVANIPYTGSGVLASAISMNKLVSKRLWVSEGLLTPDFMELHEGFDSEYVAESLGLPLAVKPISEGSSIGVTFIKKADQLNDAWQNAMKCGCGVFAERWIEGPEYSVAFVGNQVFPPVQLETAREFYDYEAKYQESGTHYICPAKVGIAEITKIQTLAWLAAESLNITGWGRIDLRHEKNSGKYWLLEANTVPGMTEHSLVPLSAKAEDIDFEQLTLKILTASDKVQNVVIT